VRSRVRPAGRSAGSTAGSPGASTATCTTVGAVGRPGRAARSTAASGGRVRDVVEQVHGGAGQRRRRVGRRGDDAVGGRPAGEQRPQAGDRAGRAPRVAFAESFEQVRERRVDRALRARAPRTAPPGRRRCRRGATAGRGPARRSWSARARQDGEQRCSVEVEGRRGAEHQPPRVERRARARGGEAGEPRPGGEQVGDRERPCAERRGQGVQPRAHGGLGVVDERPEVEPAVPW
jgi:hypothetical protein